MFPAALKEPLVLLPLIRAYEKECPKRICGESMEIVYEK
jgi:hypothetical protein